MVNIDKEIDISLDIDIKCNNCGKYLDAEYDINKDIIYVDKCDCEN